MLKHLKRVGIALAVMLMIFAAVDTPPQAPNVGAAAQVTASVGHILDRMVTPVEAAASSSYLQNHLFVDFAQRAQSFSPPATLYVTLATSSATAQACGTEVSGGSFARQAVTSALANWAGTQGAGTTTASSNASGTTGTTSNNNAITYPAPTAAWGTITTFCIFDASSGGNLWYYAALTTAKTVNNGDAAPSFAAGALTITIGTNMSINPEHFYAANDEHFAIEPRRRVLGRAA